MAGTIIRFPPKGGELGDLLAPGSGYSAPSLPNKQSEPFEAPRETTREDELEAILKGLCRLAGEDFSDVLNDFKSAGPLARLVRKLFDAKVRGPGAPPDDQLAWTRFCAVTWARSGSLPVKKGDGGIYRRAATEEWRMSGTNDLGELDRLTTVYKTNFHTVTKQKDKPGGRGWTEAQVPSGPIIGLAAFFSYPPGRVR